MDSEQIQRAFDYEFNSQAYERRIETLLEFAWETRNKQTGKATIGNYIIAVSYE